MSKVTEGDLDVEAVQAALSDRVIGRRILHFDLVGSTMDEARRSAEKGEREGTVFIAEEQTDGRGRFHRSWVSPRGENLSLSVLLRPAAAHLPSMNMAATLAVSGSITEASGLPSAIKWPNDVRVRGRKVSGILVETVMEAGTVDHAVVGIGVNVNFDPSSFPEIASTATSLRVETGRQVDRGRLLRTLLERFDSLYGRVRAGHSLVEEWAAGMDTLGRRVQVAWRGQVVEGVAESVDEQGNLMVRRADGSVFTAVAGEVTLQV